MSHRTASWLDFWTAPFAMASTAQAAMETMTSTQAVLSKRVPMLFEAAFSPWTANLPELALMVTEKVGAFGVSARSASARGRTLRIAMDGQAAAFGRLAGSGWLSPGDWWSVAERNVAICTSLIALPGEMLAPYHKGVTANARRLGRPSARF